MRRRVHFLPGVLLISAAMLTLETLLPRIFAVYMAPNFVFFSISIALVGLSSGGVALYVWEPWFLRGGVRRLADTALAFAVATVVAGVVFAVLGAKLNGTLDTIYAGVLGQVHEGSVLTTAIVVPSMLFILATGIMMAVPFFFAGTTIALAFRLAPERPGSVYAWDLVGAGIGCGVTVAGLMWLSAPRVLVLVGVLGAGGALLFLRAARRGSSEPAAGPALGRWRTPAAIGALVLLGLLAIRPPFDFQVHRYAYLRSYYATPLTELADRWTPLGRVTLAEREWVPPMNPEPTMRPLSFVGMDLGGLAVVETYSPENLERIAATSVFTDEIMEPIVVPGMFADVGDVLVVMAGTGQDMLRAYAWYGDAVDLTGVELNPAVYELGLEHPTANLAAFFDKPNVRIDIGDGRTWVERTDRSFDLIFLSYSGATFSSGTGVISSTPQFLMTKQAFVAYLEALTPGGFLVLAETSTSPYNLPRSLRTFGAALEAYRPGADVARHLLSYTRPGIFRDQNYTLYLEAPLAAEDMPRIERALAEHDLTVTWSAFTEPDYPAMEHFVSRWRETGEVEPADPASWLGLPRAAEDRVHTDNHPFFYFGLGANQPGQFLVVGYAGMALAALLVAGLFLVVPLVVGRLGRADRSEPSRGPGWFFHMAFALLGLGFMLVEVGAIQRFELFLGNPTLSLVVILAGLLIFAGVGAHVSPPLFRAGRFTLSRVAGGVVVYGMLLLAVLNRAIYPLLHLPLAAKIFLIAVLLFPLGFLLGGLFPHLLSRLQGDHERFIPWGLAINGIFSVVAANLGVLIYLFFGANVVLALGLLCYVALAVVAVMHGPDPARE